MGVCMTLSFSLFPFFSARQPDLRRGQRLPAGSSFSSSIQPGRASWPRFCLVSRSLHVMGSVPLARREGDKTPALPDTSYPRPLGVFASLVRAYPGHWAGRRAGSLLWPDTAAAV